MKLILASSSYSRRKILKNLKIQFICIPPKINEDQKKLLYKDRGYNIKKTTYELAKSKSKSISKKHKKDLVLGCDTMIELNKQTINKAKSLVDVEKTLKKISGKKHNIYSSIYLSVNNKKAWSCSEKTVVYIKKLTKKEIKLYIKKTGRKIKNSVGCYLAEETGPLIFDKIKGDFYNVLGLPILRLLNFIRKKHPGLLK